MRYVIPCLLTALLPCLRVVAPAAPPEKPVAPVAATVETTLASADGKIRQFAFDGDPNTYFASAKDAGRTDHFTLVFDKPVVVRSVTVTTGRPPSPQPLSPEGRGAQSEPLAPLGRGVGVRGGDMLDAGSLEGSADGQKFEPLAKFAEGVARAQPAGRKLRAVRVQPAADLKHPLAIREFTIDSDPPVAIFKYPIEFIVDVSDAPEMKEWAEKVARICERAYPMINEELRSDGFKPRNVIRMTLKNDYRGVAAAGGGRITGSVKFFKAHPDDVGAMVHETVHCVQSYRRGNNPGWLVEGIADYIRFFKFEPGKLRPLSPDRARYNGSYRVTAAFLAFVCDKYDKEFVRKLNAVMRAGKYKEDVWKELTGKTVQELEGEWKASLRR